MLFTDIVMPDVDGRQLAAEALHRQSNLKVLCTSGFTRNAVFQSGKLDAAALHRQAVRLGADRREND